MAKPGIGDYIYYCDLLRDEDCITLPGIKQYYRWFVKFPFDLCYIVGVMVSVLVGVKQQSLTHSFDLYTEMNNHSSEGWDRHYY